MGQEARYTCLARGVGRDPALCGVGKSEGWSDQCLQKVNFTALWAGTQRGETWGREKFQDCFSPEVNEQVTRAPGIRGQEEQLLGP